MWCHCYNTFHKSFTHTTNLLHLFKHTQILSNTFISSSTYQEHHRKTLPSYSSFL
ncbi:hypothetical protein HanRHA438_Chr15g0729581 [Helianthus annuus]|nr:hypothetical protein HanRHA438_Chr15g0729581 [Helianthus annuus]